MVRIKKVNAFNAEVFTLIEGKEYPIVFEDTYTVFIEDEKGIRVGIAKYADTSTVEILDADGNVINQPFPSPEVPEEV